MSQSAQTRKPVTMLRKLCLLPAVAVLAVTPLAHAATPAFTADRPPAVGAPTVLSTDADCTTARCDWSVWVPNRYGQLVAAGVLGGGAAVVWTPGGRPRGARVCGRRVEGVGRERNELLHRHTAGVRGGAVKDGNHSSLLAEGVVIRPGDTLIVRVARIQQDQAIALKAALEAKLPGVQIIAIGCDELAIYRPDEATR